MSRIRFQSNKLKTNTMMNTFTCGYSHYSTGVIEQSQCTYSTSILHTLYDYKHYKLQFLVRHHHTLSLYNFKIYPSKCYCLNLQKGLLSH
jgi:hypothetical protein